MEQGADKEKACNNDWTALMCAANNGHLELLRYLIEQGVDKDKATNDGWEVIRGG